MSDLLKTLSKIHWWVWLIIGMLSLCIVTSISFFVWANMPQGELMPEAIAALESDAAVRVDQSQWLVFAPNDVEPTAGFLMYPGGRIQPEAYAPLGRGVAEAGYLAVIIPVPMQLAIIDIEVATPVIEAHPEIESWVVAGHSLGGLAASSYALRHPDVINGLVLLASLPAPGAEALADYDHLQTATIYATNDGLLTPEEIESSLENLPENTQLVSIEGGNHAQFGWYGEQTDDGEASISYEEQQAQVLDIVLSIMTTVTQPTLVDE